jgi:GNAT superfamily N-acetyltransferase
LHRICRNDGVLPIDRLCTEGLRGKGIGWQLILAVYDAARHVGSSRVYWQTQSSNLVGRALYDKLAEHTGCIVYSHEL